MNTTKQTREAAERKNLTVKELGFSVGRSAKWVRKQIKAGNIVYLKDLGMPWLIPPTEAKRLNGIPY